MYNHVYLELFVLVCASAVPLVDLESAIVDEHVVTAQTSTVARNLYRHNISAKPRTMTLLLV